MTEATIASWLKQVGDVVEAGEPLAELETDKVNMDVAAERSGVLAEIVHAAGETVHPGDILAMVSEAGSQALRSRIRRRGWQGSAMTAKVRPPPEVSAR